MSVVASAPRVFRSSHHALGEGGWWDPEGELVYVDIAGQRVHRAPLEGAADGSDDGVFATPTSVSFARPTADGGLVLGLRDGIHVCDRDGAGLRPLALIDHRTPAIRMNDGAVDPHGRLVTGSQDTAGPGPLGCFYRVDADGTVAEIRDGIGVGNGPAWSPDGATIYFGDTSVQTIFAAGWGEDGVLGDVRVLKDGENHDGMCVDADGYLWSAIWGGGEVQRIDPAGRVVERIAIPAPQPTSVSFGGPELATLFVTTAAENTSRAEHPSTGAVFAVDLDVAGLPSGVFGAPIPLAPAP